MVRSPLLSALLPALQLPFLPVCAGVRLAVRRRNEVEHGVVVIGRCDRFHEPVGPRFTERECVPLVRRRLGLRGCLPILGWVNPVVLAHTASVPPHRLTGPTNPRCRSATIGTAIVARTAA